MADNEQRQARVLVVDDERSMRELLAIVLHREGYEVLTPEGASVGRCVAGMFCPTVKKYAALRAELKAKRDYAGLSALPKDAPLRNQLMASL